MKTVLAFGGTGVLGKALKSASEGTEFDFLCVGRSTVDVRNPHPVRDFIERIKPSIVLNAAAYTNVVQAQVENRQEATEVNVIGADSVAWACARTGRPLVHISTDYVYSGAKGLYVEDDHLPCRPVAGINHYAYTKILAEKMVFENIRENALIIRTTFFPRSGAWPYDCAFTDQHTSRGDVFLVALRILRGIQYGLGKVKVLNIGAVDRWSVYDMARFYYPLQDIKPGSRIDVMLKTGVAIPADTSMNQDLFDSLVNQ